MALDYGSYLQLDKLLRLQEPRSKPAEHDEMLFIVIHQVYELWFKLMLHEIEKLKRDFSDNSLFEAIHTLKRCRTVMKTLVGQLDILETMTPISFSSFRDRLETASGFQSVQFRAMEFALGFKREGTLQYHADRPEAVALLRTYLEAPSVMDHFYDFIEQQGASVPASLRNRPPTAPAQPSPELQVELLKLFKTRGEIAILFELMTDFDEGLQEWRYRHVKIVERTIGAKAGTGGSPGVPFLKQSLFKPVFPDLWEIRKSL